MNDLVDLLSELLDDKKSSIERDITKDFEAFFEKQSDNPKFSMIVWVQGCTGSGKTTFAVMFGQLLLDHDKFIVKEKDILDPTIVYERKRTIGFYNVPDEFVPNLKKAMIESGYGEFIDRIFSIKHLREIRSNMCVIVDEGILSASSKDALLKEMVIFEKGLSYSRHKRLMMLMNSVDDSILLSYRKKAHLTVYKKLTKAYIDNVKHDKFIKKHSKILQRLKDWEGILYSNYKHFDKYGKISMNLKKYAPYYNDKISQNLSNESFDSEFQKILEINKKVKQFAKIVQVEFGKDLFSKPKMNKVLEAWLEMNYPTDFYDLKRHIPKIEKYALLFQYQDQKTKVKRKKEEIEEKMLEKNQFDIDSNDALDVIEIKNDRDKKIYKMHLKGINQEDISKKPEMPTQPRISQIISEIDGKIYNYRGKGYSKWLAGEFDKKCKDDPFKNVEYYDDVPGLPDIEINFDDKEYWIYQTKCSSIIRHQNDYYKNDYQCEIDYCFKILKENPKAIVHMIFHWFSYIDKTYLELVIDLENIPDKIKILDSKEIIPCFN